MGKIRVDTSYAVIDGSDVVFTAPCNCNEADGLKVYYPGGSKEFAFRDAHGNILSGISELFIKGALVKVILDVTKGYAYIQNADTNAYLEEQLASKAPAGFGLGTSGAWVNDLNIAINSGFYCWTNDALNRPFEFGSLLVLRRQGTTSDRITQVGCNSFMLGSGEDVKKGGAIVIRHCNYIENSWTEWEWINPPMVPGVEYRTTKRHNGKVVYDKYIDLGTLPASGDKSTVYFSSGSTDVWYEAYVKTKSSNIFPMPFIITEGTIGATCYATKYSIVVVAQYDVSAHTGFAIVHYTKD